MTQGAAHLKDMTRHPRFGLSCSRGADTSAWSFSYSRLHVHTENAVLILVNAVSTFRSLTTCTRTGGCAGCNYPFLTLKERDLETGLDYFDAPYHGWGQGRFTGVDPFNIALEIQAEAQSDPKKAAAKLQIYLSLPQQWNRYSYAMNNPLVYVDPNGEAIQLSNDKDERERQMQALKDAVGSGAAGYLYAQQGSDGNWYVGIYDYNPMNGDRSGFGQVNEVASMFSEIITDPQIARLEMVTPGDVTDDSGSSVYIGRASSALAGTPAATGYFKGVLTIKLLDWGKKNLWGSNFDLGYLPGALMSNGSDNMMTPSVMVAHELAHAWYRMCGGKDAAGSNKYAVDFENKVRKLQYPNGPTRKLHNVPTSP